jgi:hypothetical protein
VRAPVDVVVQWLPVVEYDRQLYTVSQADFAKICGILKRDPYYGERLKDGRRQLVYDSLRVSYITRVEMDKVVVTLTGIRPPEEIPQTERIVRMLQVVARALLRLPTSSPSESEDP